KGTDSPEPANASMPSKLASFVQPIVPSLVLIWIHHSVHPCFSNFAVHLRVHPDPFGYSMPLPTVEPSAEIALAVVHVAENSVFWLETIFPHRCCDQDFSWFKRDVNTSDGCDGVAFGDFGELLRFPSREELHAFTGPPCTELAPLKR